jgi:hypothetical protein
VSQPRPQPEIRIGDAEREQAVSALGEHYLAGRLSKEEYDERAGAAWKAKTRSQLDPLFYDLPRMQQQVTRPAPPPRDSSWARSRKRRGFGFPILVAVVVLLAVLGAPWWAWLILGWMWFSGMLAGFGVHACRGMRHRSG